MNYRKLLIFIFLFYSGLAYAQTCPPGPFLCTPWDDPPKPNGPKPNPPPPPFFEIELKEQKNRYDLYKFIKEQPDLIFFNEALKSKEKIINRTEEYRILLDDNSLYYFPLENYRGIIFKGSELRK